MADLDHALVLLSVGWVHLKGSAWDGLSISGGRHILVLPDRNLKNEMDTWLHETLHQTLPDLSEREVVRVAKDLATVMWAAGYRRSASTKRKGRKRLPSR